MKRIKQTILCAILAVALVLSMCPSALAAERVPEAELLDTNHVIFSGVSQMTTGESAHYIVHMTDGSDAIVGIEKVRQDTRAGGATWRVWYKIVGIDVEFYMTVFNNKVTSVYDYSISLLGASFEDATLTKTSTYGKLTFTAKTIGGLATSTCWLKGTVTGTDDNIDVTWQM